MLNAQLIGNLTADWVVVIAAFHAAVKLETSYGKVDTLLLAL